MSNKGFISKIYKQLIQLNIKQVFFKLFFKWAEDLNRHFPKEDTQMANKPMKIYSISIIIREVQIKITVRYLLKPVSLYWYITKKTGDKNKSRQRCGKKKTLVHCWWEYKMVWPSRKTMWRFLKKLKLGQPYKPAIPVLSKYSKETKSLSWKDICSPCSL